MPALRTIALSVGVAAVAISVVLVAPPLVHPSLEVAEAKCRNATERPRNLTKRQARKAIVCVINKRRALRHRSRLREKTAPRRAALKHSRRMLDTGCFAHRCPGEPDLTGRLFATGYLPCKCSWGIGENIARGEQKKGSPKAIVRAWMNSPAHRKIILTKRFEHIGVGVLWGHPGRTGDRDAATYTANFGYKD